MPLGIGHVWAMTSLLSRSYTMNTPLGIGHVGADFKRGDSWLNMTQPNENSFYVTLTSSKTQEFPDNSPSHFQYRLPQSLWLPGKWKVGLASVFLPGVSNPIPHVSSSLTKNHDTIPTVIIILIDATVDWHVILPPGMCYIYQPHSVPKEEINKPSSQSTLVMFLS